MKKSFSDKLKQITQKQLKEVDETICDISRDLFKTIVDKTPVGKSEYVTASGKVWFNIPGELVNNWQSAVNSILLKIQSRPGPEKTGAIKRIDRTIVNGSFKKDGFVSLTNSTPYANMAENIGWPAPRWSGRTGPYFMVKNSIAEILAKYKH